MFLHQEEVWMSIVLHWITPCLLVLFFILFCNYQYVSILAPEIWHFPEKCDSWWRIRLVGIFPGRVSAFSFPQCFCSVASYWYRWNFAGLVHSSFIVWLLLFNRQENYKRWIALDVFSDIEDPSSKGADGIWKLGWKKWDWPAVFPGTLICSLRISAVSVFICQFRQC